MIIVVSGPGGVGKGTVVRRLVERDPVLWISRSWTTRERRVDEPSDAYVFASREEFEAKVAAGGFLEWVEFLDYLQGSPVPDPPAGCDVLFEIDVFGARQVLAKFPEATSIFLDAPSRAEQAERLRRRGDDDERIAQRLAKATEELAVAAELGSTVIINDDLDDTVAQIEALIAARREAGSSS